MNKKQKYIDLLLVFLLAFIPRLILIIMNAEVLRTPMDELSTMSTGAYFGGCDWTAITKSTGFYYGGGFTILLAPLFRFIDDSALLYKCILSICAVLQSVSAPISYHLLDYYFGVKDRAFKAIASVACSFFVVTRAMEMYNEHPVICMMWIIAWILCALVYNQENKKKKVLLTILLFAAMSYILTLHARTQVLWIAVAMVIVFYYIFYKKILVSVIPGIISACGCYLASKAFNRMVKTVVWGWVEGKKLRNSEAKMAISLELLEDPASWSAIVNIIFGQLNTITIFSGGLLVFIAVLLFLFYKNSITERITSKQVLSDVEGENKMRAMLLVVSVTFVLCTFGTIVAQSGTVWLTKMITALTETAYGQEAYGYKAVTYVRYMGPYLGPVIMAGMVMIYHKKDELKKYICPASITLVCLQIIWLGFILPHIYRVTSACEVFVPFSFFKIKGDEPMTAVVYLMGTVVLIFAFVAMMIGFFKKKEKVSLIIFAMLLIYQYTYSAIYWDGAQANNYYNASDAGTQLIQEIKEETENDDLFDKIYVYDKKTTVQRIHSTYQMLLKDETIIRHLPNEKVEEAVVFSNELVHLETLGSDYRWAQLDENEYIFVKGEDYINLFEDHGIALKEQQ